MFGIGGNAEGLKGVETQKSEVPSETPEQREVRLGGSPEATTEQPKPGNETVEKLAEIINNPDNNLGVDDKMALASLTRRIQAGLESEQASFRAVKDDLKLEGSVADVLAKIKDEHNGNSLGFGMPRIIISKEIGDNGYVIVDENGKELVSSDDKNIPSYGADRARGEELKTLSPEAQRTLFESLGAIEPGADLDKVFDTALVTEGNQRYGRFPTNNPDVVLLVKEGPANGDKPTTTIELGFNPEKVFEGV